MKLLFRAFASSTHKASLIEETMVFFESGMKGAGEHLRNLLSLVWSVPAETIDICNICSETELHQQALSEAVCGSTEWDLQLMEMGWANNEPLYPEECPVFLVSPCSQQRLVQTFMQGVSRMADISQVAICRGCGCDDNHACINIQTKRPCHWLTVNRNTGVGVCSECAVLLNKAVRHA
ncbi:Uncharacterised protein [Serratia entomophila]|uniref:hypothetical protein n=1 Tax=Serratia entomophila TaxID=42906 RepID=UPI00217830C6|nr:hypothetical protein [Serratia entomophila]CAI1913281.1 Uncharacterised protein [Serratia entomophila]